jgi:segregation and condensation protein A
LFIGGHVPVANKCPPEKKGGRYKVWRASLRRAQMRFQMASPYKIHLEAYEGPLDLLLDLIKKQEIDIHNIPIAKITGQYLEYLHKLEQLDMDISADFIYMAATLIYIKSKMLLPPDPLAGPDEQEDPRADLVHRLVEHEKFKSAAQLLHQRQQIEEHVWSKPDLTL